MTLYRKTDFPVDRTRQHLEPGPIVLVTSSWRGTRNVMTLGWHGMIAYSQIITYIWDANHSFELIRKSRACVINVPTAEMAETVVGVGNCSGADVDKFEQFGLNVRKGVKVAAPVIRECYASFECRLDDDSLIDSRGLFIWNVVKAHVDASVKNPHTLHYRGDGRFMIGGEARSLRSQFRLEMLDS